MNITDQQIDALREMINIGVGSGADVLNIMLDSHVRLQIPFLKVILPNELENEMQAHHVQRLSAVNLRFKGSFLGTAELVFPSESASKLISGLTGEQSQNEDDPMRACALSEVGNIVLNAVMGSISNLLDLSLSYSVPNYVEGDVKKLMVANKIRFDTVILLARTRFTIENLEVEGDILLFLEVGSFDKLLTMIDVATSSLGASE